MKIYKFIFLTMGIMGLVASLLNIFYIENGSGTNLTGFISSVFLIWVSQSLDTLVTRFNTKSKLFHSEDE